MGCRLVPKTRDLRVIITHRGSVESTITLPGPSELGASLSGEEGGVRDDFKKLVGEARELGASCANIYLYLLALMNGGALSHLPAHTLGSCH